MLIAGVNCRVVRTQSRVALIAAATWIGCDRALPWRGHLSALSGLRSAKKEFESASGWVGEKGGALWQFLKMTGAAAVTGWGWGRGAGGVEDLGFDRRNEHCGPRA